MSGSRRCLTSVLFVLLAFLPAVANGQQELPPNTPVEDIVERYNLTPAAIVQILAGNSLMLSSVELARIDDAKRAASQIVTERPTSAGLSTEEFLAEPVVLRDFRLDAILYTSGESWMIWLNGEALSPGKQPSDVQVRRVTPQRVEFLWTPEATQFGGPKVITLEPGQVYLVASGATVEAAEFAASGGGDGTVSVDIAAEPVDATGATGLPLSEDQVARLAELQSALSAISGNAAALGLSEEDLAELQAGLAASGSSDGLTERQRELLERIQQVTGAEP